MTTTHALHPVLTIDASGELCARSVQRVSRMTRGELESFLHATARALASVPVVVAPARRPKPEKSKRAPRWRR